MAHTLPLMADSQALRRFGKLYLAAFWFATASLYVSLIQAGYDPRLALTSAAAAAIGCLLLRLAQEADVPALAATPREDGLLRERDLVQRIDQLMREARLSEAAVGVMLVSVRSIRAGDDRMQLHKTMNLVRGGLFRDADSRVYQVDEQTFAVTESRDDTVAHFERIAKQLRSEFLNRRTALPELTSVRLTVGVAVAESWLTSPRDLVSNARAAIRLAETQGRDTFFRRV